MMIQNAGSVVNSLQAVIVNKFFFTFPLSVIYLFFFQSLNELVSSVYALNFLPGVSVNFMLFFMFLPLLGPCVALIYGFAPIVFRVCTKTKSTMAFTMPATLIFVVSVSIAIILRLIMPFFDNPARCILSSLAVFFFLMAFPFMTEGTGLHGSTIAEYDAFNNGCSLCMAIMLKMCATVAGNTIDVTIYPVSGYFAISWCAGILTIILYGALAFYRVLVSVKTRGFIEDSYSIIQSPVSDISEIELEEAMDQFTTTKEEKKQRIIKKNMNFFDPLERQRREKLRYLSEQNQNSREIPWYKAIVLGFGMMNCLTMLYLTGANPAPFARWADANYFTIHLVVLGSVVAYLILVVIRRGIDVFPNLRVYAIHLFNIVGIVLFTIATVLSAKMTSTMQLAAYILVLITLILTFMTIFNFQNMSYDLTNNPNTFGKVFFVSIGFILGYAAFALICFLAAFSFNSGEIDAYKMRDLYWLVPFIANSLSWLPTCLLWTSTYLYGDENPLFDRKFWLARCFGTDEDVNDSGFSPEVITTESTLTEREKTALMLDNQNFLFKFVLSHVLVFILSIVVIAFLLWGLFSFRSDPGKWKDKPSDVIQFTVYNIRQGYDSNGNRAYSEILSAMNTLHPDVIALIDSDTNRITNAHEDAVRFFANKLDYYSYYGPVPTAGAKGISILSRFQILNEQTSFVTVKHEKIPIITVTLAINKIRWSVIIVRLNSNTEDQRIALNEILLTTTTTPSLSNTVIMGEFEFDDNELLYKNMTDYYSDAWSHLPHTPALTDRAPYIFVSPDLNIKNATLHSSFDITTYSPFSAYIPQP